MIIRYAKVENELVVMVSAIEQDGFISCPEWVRVGCTYSNGEFLPLQKTVEQLFTEDMNELNKEYDKNSQALSLKFLSAASRDGSQEASKVESVRAEIAALDSQYESDKLAIINKHYGA